MILQAMEEGTKLMDKYEAPFIIVQGGIDKLVDPDVGHDLMRVSPSKDKTCLYYQNLWHDVWHEHEIYHIMPRVIEWANKRLEGP